MSLYTNNNNYLVQRHEYNGFHKGRNNLIVEKPYPPSDLRIVIKRAPAMAPPKSKVEEIQEALKLPWLPFDMSQPNNGESVKNLVRDIYVSCKLIPTFEEFVKERSSELENIMKRRPTVVPKIKIFVESDSTSECSIQSNSAPESSPTKCDPPLQNSNVFPIVSKRKKLIVRSVKRILNNDKRSFKLLNVSLKKLYRRTKVTHCVVSLVRMPDDKYHEMINQTQVESHANVPETTESLVPEVQNKEMDTSTTIDPPDQSNIVPETTEEISQTEKPVQELVIEKTIDTPYASESTSATPEVNIIKTTDERLNSPKLLTDITNNLDKTKDGKQLVDIVKTTEPKHFISKEVEFTKKPIQEKPLSYNDAEDIEMKPSLSEINMINNSILKNVDISNKSIPVGVAPCPKNDVEIKPSLSEINIINNSTLKNVDISVKTSPKDVKPCATNDAEMKPSLSEINIIKSPFKNVDISVKTVPKDVEPCPANNSGVKTSLSEISIIKSPSKNVDIILKTISKDVTLNEKVETSLTKSPRPNMSFPSLPGIDISRKAVVSPRPLLPEIDLRKKSEILDSINAKTVVKEINIKKSPDVRLPDINIVKSDVSKPVDSLNTSISKEVHIARNPPPDGSKTLHEVDIRKKVEPTASITRISKEVNIERKSGDPVHKSTESSIKSDDNSTDSEETKKQSSCERLPVDTKASITCVSKEVIIERKSVDSVPMSKTERSKSIKSDDYSSDSGDGLTTQTEVDIRKKVETITRISKEVNIERKSADSHKSKNEKLKRAKSTESENSSSEVKSSACERSSPEETSKTLHEVDMLKKVEPIARISKEVNEKKSEDSFKSKNEEPERINSTKPVNSEATKNSSSCERSALDGPKKLREVDMWENIEATDSVPKKVKRSKSTKPDDNSPNLEETKKSNSCERSSPGLDKDINKSSSEERKCTSFDRLSPDLAKSRVKSILKSSRKDRKSTSSEGSLPDLAKSIVKHISKSSSKDRKSTSSERSLPDLAKLRVKQISKSSSEERKSTSSERSLPDLAKSRVKEISKSSSEERKSTSSERSSPDLSKLDSTSKASFKRKSESSSNVKKDPRKQSELKRRKSQDTTNSKHDDKHEKSSLELTSKETEKTRTSQERDSSKKSDNQNEKISKHRRHSTDRSKNESFKERRKSSDERRQHRNSKDRDMEPEKKKQRLESKSPENVLENKPEDNSREIIRVVSPPENRTMDDHPAVKEVLQDNKGNIERRCESNSQIRIQPETLKFLKFTTYSCIKCDAEFSSHAEWANHPNCKSTQENVLIKLEKLD